MEVTFDLPMDILRKGYENNETQRLVISKLEELYSKLRKTTPIHIDIEVPQSYRMSLLAVARKTINYIFASRNDKFIVYADIKYRDRGSGEIGVAITRASDYAPFDVTGKIMDFYIEMRPFSFWGKHKSEKIMFRKFFEGLSLIEGPFSVQIEFGFAKYKESIVRWKISYPDVDNCARGALSNLYSKKIVSIKMRKINTTEDYIHIVLAKPKDEESER